MKTQTPLNFVIVGHVDHGKSTLIGRLLYDTNSLAPDKLAEVKKISAEHGRETEFAFLLDHLEEERKQGITIDTTQVFFKTQKRRYVIIDAPGHVEFVKNMITGASQAEAAVLIVDAVEGVKEQTKRHSYMLSMLGLKQVVVVINKMDLVDFAQERFNEVCSDIENFLDSINIKPNYYIPISGIKGDNIANKSLNMDWYKGLTFMQSLDELKNNPANIEKDLILPVQDVYKIDDKRINVGRIEAGKIKTGDAIKILPSNQETAIKSVEKFLEETDEATSGECIGFTTQDSVFLDRGDIICRSGAEPVVTNRFRANMFWMSRKSFSIEQKLIIRCATQEIRCKVETIEKRINSSSLELVEENSDKLENLEVGEVVIKTKKPIAIKKFSQVQELGRFVMILNENIVAGGIITELD